MSENDSSREKGWRSGRGGNKGRQPAFWAEQSTCVMLLDASHHLEQEENIVFGAVRAAALSDLKAYHLFFILGERNGGISTHLTWNIPRYLTSRCRFGSPTQSWRVFVNTPDRTSEAPRKAAPLGTLPSKLAGALANACPFLLSPCSDSCQKPAGSWLKRWLLPLSIRRSDLCFDRVRLTTLSARHQGGK